MSKEKVVIRSIQRAKAVEFGKAEGQVYNSSSIPCGEVARIRLPSDLKLNWIPLGGGERAAPAKEVVQYQGDARESGQQAAGWTRTR